MRKILILRLSSLGDIVHATAAIAPLRAARCEIHFVVKPAFAEFLRSCAPDVHVYTYDASADEKQARENLFTWLEQQKFSAILDLHDSLRTKFWRFRLRRHAPVFVACKPRLREFCVYLLRQRWLGLGRGGRAERMRATAERAVKQLWGESPTKNVPLTELVAPELNPKRLAELPQSSYFVVVPGSAWEGKRLPVEKFVQIAEALAKTAPVVVLGGANESYCETVAAAAKRIAPESISLHGRTTISECAAILASARAILGNDTGLIHMAEALGRDVVAVEGPTDPSLGYSVYRPKSQIISAGLSCSPCSKNGHPCLRFGTRACMQRIDVQKTVAAVMEKYRGA